MPTILDNLKTTNDLEMRSLTGFLRNLSRYSRDKNSLGKYRSHSYNLMRSRKSMLLKWCLLFCIHKRVLFSICLILAPKVVANLMTILPNDGYQKLPSPEVVINICGALNNLVSCSEVAARDIAFFDGLTKLVGIRNSHDNRYKALSDM